MVIDKLFGLRRCKECGFLCFLAVNNREKAFEYTQKERALGVDRFSIHSTPQCYRHDFAYEVQLQAILDLMQNEFSNFGDVIYPKEKLKAILDLITKKRHCKLFMKYASGFSPELHLTRYEMFERERSNRLWNFLWAVFGAALTIIAGVIIKLLFPTTP